MKRSNFMASVFSIASCFVLLSSTCKVYAASFQPYIGPYLTLMVPGSDEIGDSTPKSLDSSTHMIVNYETKNPSDNFFGKVSFRKKGGSL